jgi:radical SAM protein with 4Fe4S-binding SPASM domain
MRFLRLVKIYHAYKKGLPSPGYNPIRLWIEPTNKCNLKCKMCPHGQEKVDFEKGFMDIELFKKLIDEAACFKADVNLFMGGESLLHPQIIDMIRYMKKLKVPSRLYTNATLLSPEASEELIRSGLDHITFSFDGIHKEIYENHRKGAGFEKTLENIRRFLALKRTLNLRKPYTVIQCLEFNETPIKQAGKKQFKALFDQKMVNAFTFISPHSFGGACREFSMSKAHRHYSPCAFLWYSMSIMWDGTVVPCCVDMLKKYPIGNAEENSLSELWNSDTLAFLRGKIYQGLYQGIEPCTTCDILWKKKRLGVPIKSIYNLTDMLRRR